MTPPPQRRLLDSPGIVQAVARELAAGTAPEEVCALLGVLALGLCEQDVRARLARARTRGLSASNGSPPE